MSSQGMFSSSLKCERNLGLNFWDNDCPRNTSISFSLVSQNSDKPGIHWQGIVETSQAIDQRLKFPYWMDIFEKKGGRLVIENVDSEKLDLIAGQNDLTIVSTGKGELGKIFPRNNEFSHFDTPQRALCCFYVKKMKPAWPQGIHINLIQGIGEYFTMSGLTHNGPCEMMLFEGIPGGPLDCWNNMISSEELLIKARELLKTFVPWEAERCNVIELTDENAFLTGCYTPVIRHATSILPCRKAVLGLGDAIVLNDPIAGQGANYASKSAYLYAENIIQRGDKPFDNNWMEETGNHSWERYGSHATQLSNLLLQSPPSGKIMDMLKEAENNQGMANRIAHVFDDSSSLAGLLLNRETYIYD